MSNKGPSMAMGHVMTPKNQWPAATGLGTPTDGPRSYAGLSCPATLKHEPQVGVRGCYWLPPRRRLYCNPQVLVGEGLNLRAASIGLAPIHTPTTTCSRLPSKINLLSMPTDGVAGSSFGAINKGSSHLTNHPPATAGLRPQVHSKPSIKAAAT